MLYGMEGVELKVLVSMCGFPIDADFNGSIGIPICLPVEKCNGSVFLFFYIKFDMLVNGVEMGVKFCKVLHRRQEFPLSATLH